MKNRNNILYGFFGLIPIIFGIISTGCTTTIAWDKVDLDLKRSPRSQVYNLKNETVGLEADILKQVEDIMRNYFDPRSEEMGYYTVNFTYSVSNSNMFWPTLAGGTLMAKTSA